MNNIYSISDINSIIKSAIFSNKVFQHIQVRGEISNFKRYESGHCYFTLKDNSSILKCVMFKARASLARFKVENGLSVVASGKIDVYERDGVYQLYIDNLFLDGVGDLTVRFEKLKEKLEKLGFFDEQRKKSLPFMPKNLGVVTSASGAVLHDIITVSNKRNPNVNIVFYPVRVQGKEAPPEIAFAIEQMNRYNLADVIIVGRGGGSLEELWAFNEEIVVKAVANSSIPIISAVGHQTDFTLCDFAADVRAATPSQAAEIAVLDRTDLLHRLENYQSRLKNTIQNKLDNYELRLNYCMKSRFLQSPDRLFEDKLQYIDSLRQRLHNNLLKNIRQKEQQMQLLTAKLDSLSPLRVLSRGFSVTTIDKTLVYLAKIKVGDNIQTRFIDGTVYSKVDKIEKKV